MSPNDAAAAADFMISSPLLDAGRPELSLATA
jgi:hypothetical protein